MRQRESEAAVLGQQLQRQTAELEEVLQGAGSQDETQRLLQQANANAVRKLQAKHFEACLYKWSTVERIYCENLGDLVKCPV